MRQSPIQLARPNIVVNKHPPNPVKAAYNPTPKSTGPNQYQLDRHSTIPRYYPKPHTSPL